LLDKSNQQDWLSKPCVHHSRYQYSCIIYPVTHSLAFPPAGKIVRPKWLPQWAEQGLVQVLVLELAQVLVQEPEQALEQVPVPERAQVLVRA
jgi:hypothetical protein